MNVHLIDFCIRSQIIDNLEILQCKIKRVMWNKIKFYSASKRNIEEPGGGPDFKYCHSVV